MKRERVIRVEGDPRWRAGKRIQMLQLRVAARRQGVSERYFRQRYGLPPLHPVATVDEAERILRASDEELERLIDEQLVSAIDAAFRAALERVAMEQEGERHNDPRPR
ncbi:MAG: hypothetical protein QJR08_04245 [Bacillota bacterium]|nr:hypothetical protein [Bacillota bacterium]